ncbi:unnamed protein product [Thelazia callipaeda]|uniref:Protein KRI1 homolog n=1 Tax=Thelazia callipaeda TaxID=103827 RepID=A0A0N5D9Y2_THECL|nr:unnamed protein product [Thelazia callipaeda]
MPQIIAQSYNRDISDDEGKLRISKSGYYEQQRLAKQKFNAVIIDQHDSDGDSEPLLRPRLKTEKEKHYGYEKRLSEFLAKNEEIKYHDWLRGQEIEGIPDVEELKGLKEAWNDKNLDESERFLRDYLLNKQVPSYDEIVNLEEDEEEFERENEFERKYNFRYEEPDIDFIRQYPRTIKQSLRKKNERRKQKRESYRERKKMEKQARKDEIKELRALRKAEIEEKLKKLKKLTGDDDLPLSVDDLEADFDPLAYDKRMEEVFNSQYYAKNVEDEEKPVFSSTSDGSSDEFDCDTFDVGEGKKKEVKQKIKGHDDAENCSQSKQASPRKRKRNSRFLKAVFKKKPLFSSGEKSFEEYFNEYYGLEYEDIIADGLITKFKYRDVIANNFGLTVDELLSADDRQLNAWASLKKATAYRSEAEEWYDVKAYEKKALNIEKKKRIFSTDFGGKKSKKLSENISNATSSVQTSNINKKRNRRKKKHMKSNHKLLCAAVQETSVGTNKSKIGSGRIHKKNENYGKFEEFSAAVGIDNDRLRAYGINPKKYKSKLFHRQWNSLRKNENP